MFSCSTSLFTLGSSLTLMVSQVTLLRCLTWPTTMTGAVTGSLVASPQTISNKYTHIYVMQSSGKKIGSNFIVLRLKFSFCNMIWFNPIHIGFNKKKVFGIMENILMTYQYFLFQNKFTSLLIFIWTN